MTNRPLTVDELFRRREEYVALARRYKNPDVTLGGLIDGLWAMGEGARAMPYAFYRDLYRGGAASLGWIPRYEQETDASWEHRRRRLFGINYTRPLIDKIVQAEYGRPIVLNFREPHGREAAFYESLCKAVRLHDFRARTARQRAVDGVCIVQLVWDDSQGRVLYRHILPEHFHPVLGDDYDTLEAAIVERCRPVWDDSEGRLVERTFTEVHTPDDSALWIDGVKVPAPENQARYGFLPFFLWQGRRLIGSAFGDSLARGPAELNHAINLVANNIAEMIRYQGFSLLVIQGGAGGIEIDPRTGEAKLRLAERDYLHLAADASGQAKAEYITPSPKIGECLEVLDRWTRYMFETGGVPIVAVSPQQDHVESGLSRQISFVPLVDVVSELWTADQSLEERLFRASIRIHNTHAVRAADRLDPDVAFEIGEPQRAAMPIDDKSLTDVLVARRHAGLITLDDALRELNPYSSAAEIAEKRMELESQGETSNTIEKV